MLTQEVVQILQPFRYALSKSSFNYSHRCLEISNRGVRCLTPYIDMDIMIYLDIVEYKQPLHVNGETFLSVLNSLPESKELKLAHRDNALHWTCGNTKGKMACLNLPPLAHSQDYLSYDENTPSPSREFLSALELGSLSADASSMASVGMSGVVIDTERLIIASTDDVTISACTFKDCLPNLKILPRYITLSPETVPFLSNALEEHGYWFINENVISYSDGIRDIIVSQVAQMPRQSTMLALIRKCSEGKIAFAIPGDTIRTFLKRADALTTSRPQLSVSIAIENGRVTLEFDEATAQTQEYFNIPDLGLKGPMTLKMSARKLVRALKYCSEIVLDFMPEHILVLRSKDFIYIIGGK